VDILFLPVGEVSTITIDTATEILRQLEARIVIPMHYKTDVISREFEPASLLKYATSGDTTGDFSRVVGYGSIVISRWGK
ncbi:unnamed protein product, partial [marine sediment metagenome]